MKQVESFFWGIIAALGALILQLIIYIGFSIYPYPAIANLSFSQLFTLPIFIVIAASIEEIFRYIIISKRIDMLSLGRSYVINSFFVGLGFFATELALTLTAGAVPQTRILIEIAIIHIGNAGLMGYIVAIKNPKKISTLVHALLLTVFFHAAYNILILNRTFALNYVIIAILAAIVTINIVNFFRISKKLA